MASISDSVTNFAVRFCNELDNGNNFICSPLSAEIILAMVTLGSSGDTQAELLAALDIPNEDALRSKFNSLTKSLNLGSFSILYPSSWIPSMCKLVKKGTVTLKIANKIYVKEGSALKPGLVDDAKKIFKSSLAQIDFSKSEDAANTINHWVATQTRDIIKDIVSPNMLNGSTALVLVNAIYFYGLWEIPFERSRPGNFHVNSTKVVSIYMMEMEMFGRSFNYKHCPKLNAKILQMFYRGGEASMVIVLPDKTEGLSDVMRLLTAGYDLMAEIKSLKKTRLQMVLPKFKVETKIDLMGLLPKMGIKKIFENDESEINMLTSDERLHVSAAVQKAYIVVDETGTEAAAATAIAEERVCGIHWTGETFIADHPFLFLLECRRIPLFYGIFKEPTDVYDWEKVYKEFRDIIEECKKKEENQNVNT